MKTKIIDSNIVIHTVPLEKIDFDTHLTVAFDDVNLNRITKKIINVVAFKVVYDDVWDYDYMCDEAFYTDEKGNEKYKRYIYELLDSKWIDELRKNSDEQDADVFEKNEYHHYVLILGDKILEVVAEKII